MAKRIFRSVVCTAMLAVLLTSALLIPSLYGVYERHIANTMRDEADYLVRILDATGDDLSSLSGFHTQSRVTLIAPNGDVLYDSAAEAAQMENHAERPELRQAMQCGSGESKRYSATLSEITIYDARRTASGNVLRIANTRSSMLGVFLGAVPQIVLMLGVIFALSLAMARFSARRIVAPINTLRLNEPLANDIYDELAPLLIRMEKQRVQLDAQMASLDKARSELAAIMENMREGLILLDEANTVLSINASAATFFHVTADERVGQSILAVTRNADIHELVEQAHAGCCGNTLLHMHDHAYRVMASPVETGSHVQSVALLILDVTAGFAAEASRREFSANVSHELKTPLTSISGYAEIIRDGIAQPQDVPGFAGKICAEASRLIALVNDVLELSRLDEKQGLGRRECVELKKLLSALMDDFALAARKKEIELVLEAEAVCVEGHPVLLREMFFNLIDNAVKYTPEGGCVRVSAVRDGKFIRCSVSDTGIGIPREHQPHVFERFYRVDKSHSRATGGTGLGLAIVKHVAEIHHAAVRLTSQEGKGTTVCVDFAAEALEGSIRP